jgi:hypothetical protein
MCSERVLFLVHSFGEDSPFDGDVEDSCFHELSLILMEFEDGTQDLEGFSEIPMQSGNGTEDLEGFSETPMEFKDGTEDIPM